MNGNLLFLPTVLIAAILFFVGIRLHRRYPTTSVLLGFCLSLPCLFAVFYYAHLFDNWAAYYETRSWRFSELTFAGVAFLGGSLHDWHHPDTYRERAFFPLLTLIILAVPFIKPYLYPLDLNTLQDRCDGIVCLQSSLATCGPASAATILRSFGQNATERELARESFTYGGGTEIWYLARTLRQRGYDVSFYSHPSDLPHPAIAGVKLGGGAGHFIVLLDVTNESATLVDPIVGESRVPLSEVHKKYNFTGFFLTVKKR